MADVLSDFTGLNVEAEEFLSGVLETVAQPIWVVDHEGLIRFANPAAAAALGYDSPDEPRRSTTTAPMARVSGRGVPDAAPAYHR
jgi:PAS domain-containing protein